MKILAKSWEARPFVDILVLTDDQAGSDTNENSCPESHPDDLFYEIWMGTRAMCDCLERSKDRKYDLDTLCIRGRDAPHNSEDCKDVGSEAPMV